MYTSTSILFHQSNHGTSRQSAEEPAGAMAGVGSLMGGATSLERTYLSYHRTAMVFGMLSVVTAQLTVINHAPNPSPTFGFRTVGKPLSVVLACCALIISIVGVLRWWRLQNGLLRGVSISGGRELVVVGAIVGAVIAGTLGLVVAVDITKEY
ncbi:hypothetical protein P167DRAFT_543800 [Morchella conica CCBAS932]|uniref:DUF202 domain-containing protein n=1 Tax=Morchella conica CCBAS932 TaxID=1392247 RepID=A0A3N4KXN3_9PEZI|nr:hypothetical protein P167DRAFT_543800 [Morchella conica CCBAS932]